MLSTILMVAAGSWVVRQMVAFAVGFVMAAEKDLRNSRK